MGPPEWRTYPIDEEPARSDPPGPATPYAPPGAFPLYERATGTPRVRRRFGLLLGGAAIVLVGAGAGAWDLLATGGDAGTTTTTTTTTTSGVDLFTDEGLAALAGAVRAETGSNDVLEVTMFQRWAVVTVAGEGDRTRTFQWNGTLTPAAASPSPGEPFDLREVEADVVARLCADATTTCAVVARRPTGPRDVWLTVTDGSGGVQRTDRAGNPR